MDLVGLLRTNDQKSVMKLIRMENLWHMIMVEWVLKQDNAQSVMKLIRKENLRHTIMVEWVSKQKRELMTF